VTSVNAEQLKKNVGHQVRLRPCMRVAPDVSEIGTLVLDPGSPTPAVRKASHQTLILFQILLRALCDSSGLIHFR